MRVTVSMMPIWVCTRREVEAATVAVNHDLVDPRPASTTMWRERYESATRNPGPSFWGVAVVFDETGPVGWSGWLPYLDEPNTWQNTIFLAPHLRGSGVFDVLLCDQTHRAHELTRRWGLESPVFMTSIATDNVRSLGAHQRWTTANGWGDWEHRWEPAKGRFSWVTTWPSGMGHTCYL